MTTDYCDQKPRRGVAYPDSKAKPPGFGEASGDHPIRRCPACNRRLRLRAVYGGAYEFLNWRLPEHKPRETRKPGLKRQSRARGRGK